MRMRRIEFWSEILVLIIAESGDLVEAHTIKQRIVHWLCRAYGERSRWQEDGKDDGGQGSSADGLEDEPDRFPDEPGEGLKDRLGRIRGGGHEFLLS